VLSFDYLSILFTQRHWAAAFNKKLIRKRNKLLLVRVQECRFRGLPIPHTYIDLAGSDEKSTRERLLAELHRHHPKLFKWLNFKGLQHNSVPVETRFPGVIPPVWNVPYQRNTYFTGREIVLDKLRTALVSNKSCALTQDISGTGGVGKTQLALEYSERFLALQEAKHGARHPETAAVHGLLGDLLRRLDRYEDAGTHHERAWTILQ
jgi:hypothetical protein